MSAPLLWIGLPLLGALLSLLMSSRSRLLAAFSTLFASGLALLAWLLPFGRLVTLGPLQFRLNQDFEIFGRRLFLAEAERPVLMLLFLLAAFWFGGAYMGRAGRFFAPTALTVLALLIAALAVEPFLYGGLLIAVAVLMCVPLLVQPGQAPGRGVLRFLTFQLLGMPFILLTGWMLTGVATRPEDPVFITRAAGFLGFGFILLLGVFPFHSWVLMLCEEQNLYARAFVLVLLPWTLTLFGLTFLERYSWLSSAEAFPWLLRLAGMVMVAVAGGWAAFERDLGRLLGYAVLAENGFMLLALSLPGGVSLHFTLLLPRLLALGLWALALALLQPHLPHLRFSGLLGQAYHWPVAAAALVLAQLCIAGLPLLAGFPGHFAVWQGLAVAAPATAWVALLPCAGFIVSALRSLAALVSAPDEQHWQVGESRAALLLLGLGMAALLLIGTLPQWFLPFFAGSAAAFGGLLP